MKAKTIKFKKPNAAKIRLARKQTASLIIALRKKNGLSQDKLAKLSGLDRKTINRIENNHFSPSLDTYLRILSVFKKQLVVK